MTVRASALLALLCLCSAYDVKDPTADHTGHAVELQAQGRDELALASFAAAARFGGSAQDHMNWAHGLLKVNDREQAGLQFSKALEIEPQNDEAALWARELQAEGARAAGDRSGTHDQRAAGGGGEDEEDANGVPPSPEAAAALHTWREHCGDPGLWVSPGHRAPGYHALCFYSDQAAAATGGEEQERPTKLVAFVDGFREHPLSSAVPPGADMRGVRAWLERLLGVEARRTDAARQAALAAAQKWVPQKWRVFDAQRGARVRTLAQLRARRDGAVPLLLFEGGQWIWPGLSVGYEREVPIKAGSESESRRVTLRTMSLRPLLFSVQNFLLKNECDHVIGQASGSMSQSSVSLMDRDAGKEAVEFRTSETTFVSSHGDPLMEGIDQRVEALTRVPETHQESVQVLKYGKGARYDPHLDYWVSRERSHPEPVKRVPELTPHPPRPPCRTLNITVTMVSRP